MSDHYITLIPQNPRFIPLPKNQHAAQELFASIAPQAEKIEFIIGDQVRFFDCGENFETIHCPACQKEICIDWWQDQMDEDYRDDSFCLNKYSVPCCNALLSLADLKYTWTQGFACFALEAMNPCIGQLTDSQVAQFESILDTPLHVIYQHL